MSDSADHPRDPVLEFSSHAVQERELSGFLARYLQRLRLISEQNYGDPATACGPYLAELAKAKPGLLQTELHPSELVDCEKSMPEAVAEIYWSIIAYAAAEEARRTAAADAYARLVIKSAVPVSKPSMPTVASANPFESSLREELQHIENLRKDCGRVDLSYFFTSPNGPPGDTDSPTCVLTELLRRSDQPRQLNVWEDIHSVAAQHAITLNNAGAFYEFYARYPTLCESLPITIIHKRFAAGEMPSFNAIIKMITMAQGEKNFDATECFASLRELSINPQETTDPARFFEQIEGILADMDVEPEKAHFGSLADLLGIMQL